MYDTIRDHHYYMLNFTIEAKALCSCRCSGVATKLGTDPVFKKPTHPPALIRVLLLESL